uniref:Uncharacterized protein n=1 Tax=Onchocerca volvulus TaxID=6282 RepID=A0A8R1Y812_ONCVO
MKENLPPIGVHENITRKLEQLVADMTRQLIANASDKEDVEVEVKMLFGKLVGSPKDKISQNSINKNLCPMRRISVSPKTSSVNHAYSITSHYSSPIQQITIEKDRTSTNEKIKEKRKSKRNSGSFDIVTFRKSVG